MQNTLFCGHGLTVSSQRRIVHIGGYLRAAADQRQLQNVTARLGPHSGLRGRHAAVTAGYHLSKRHWNTITLDGSAPDDEVLARVSGIS